MGYETSTESGGCSDVDECKGLDSPCPANSNCTNSPGSFACHCLAGYSDDGVGCITDKDADDNPPTIVDDDPIDPADEQDVEQSAINAALYVVVLVVAVLAAGGLYVLIWRCPWLWQKKWMHPEWARRMSTHPLIRANNTSGIFTPNTSPEIRPSSPGVRRISAQARGAEFELAIQPFGGPAPPLRGPSTDAERFTLSEYEARGGGQSWQLEENAGSAMQVPNLDAPPPLQPLKAKKKYPSKANSSQKKLLILHADDEDSISSPKVGARTDAAAQAAGVKDAKNAPKSKPKPQPRPNPQPAKIEIETTPTSAYTGPAGRLKKGFAQQGSSQKMLQARGSDSSLASEEAVRARRASAASAASAASNEMSSDKSKRPT